MKTILDAIGKTPMIEIQKINPYPKVKILAKLEGANPAGSVKDRIAKTMIQDAEKKGLLTPGKTIIEATSGNTGLGLAMISSIRGYRFIAVMPASASAERKKLLRAYGTKIIFTDAKKGTNGAIKTAQKILQKNKSYFMPDQFNNPLNPLTHYQTTGMEIIKQAPDINIFVAGMGTGGTLMGVGKRLKEYNPKIKIVGIEHYAKEKISGLRNMKAYTPSIFDENKLDKKIMARERNALKTAKLLFSKEGVSAGISSGAAMWAALKMAKEIKKGTIVVLFPDKGDKYLSTALFK